MTFQDIVEGMVREDSENWVQDLLMEYGNEYHTTAAEDIRFGNLADGKVYFCKVEILNAFNMPYDIVEVLGKITDRVKHRQIMRNGNTIWHDSSFIREEMGIKEFRI